MSASITMYVLTEEQVQALALASARTAVSEYIKRTEKDRLLNLTQMAAEFGITRQTVARIADENALPRHGGKLSIREFTRIWQSR